MRIGVYSLQRVLYRGEAASVNCQTATGEITILNHHRPLISILKKGVMKIVDGEKKEHYIPVESGFLEVRRETRRNSRLRKPKKLKFMQKILSFKSPGALRRRHLRRLVF